MFFATVDCGALVSVNGFPPVLDMSQMTSSTPTTTKIRIISFRLIIRTCFKGEFNLLHIYIISYTVSI